MSKHCLTFYSYCYYTKKLYKCVNTDLNTRHTIPPAVAVFSEGEARNKEGEEGEQNWKQTETEEINAIPSLSNPKQKSAFLSTWLIAFTDQFPFLQVETSQER